MVEYGKTRRLHSRFIAVFSLNILMYIFKYQKIGIEEVF